jgi:hypothetical protein
MSASAGFVATRVIAEMGCAMVNRGDSAASPRCWFNGIGAGACRSVSVSSGLIRKVSTPRPTCKAFGVCATVGPVAWAAGRATRRAVRHGKSRGQDFAEPFSSPLDIADRLGFGRASNIRNLIERNSVEIAGFGTLLRCEATSPMPNGGVKAINEYWLNEEQALLVSVLSKAP